MKITMNVALPLLIVSFILATNPAAFVANAQNCGHQAGGNKCTDSSCCSKYGWCGNSDTHCGDGCQSNCNGGGGGGGGDGGPKNPSPHDTGNNSFAAFQAASLSRQAGVMVNGGGGDPYSVPHCGTQGGGGKCDPGYCCSHNGFCGTSDKYCGAGCQSGCQGGGGGGGDGHGASPSNP